MSQDDFKAIHASKLDMEPSSAIYAPVDGGADTCLLGNEFYISDIYSDRFIDVIGYHDEMITKNIPVGTGITTCELPDGSTVLLRCHEGVAMGRGQSLFSTNQIRHNGHSVHDVPVHYGGKQVLVTQDGQQVPMAYHLGICCFKIRYPTQLELDSLPIIDLTSEEMWNPHVGETDPYDGLFEHEDTGFGESFALKTHTEHKEPDWDHVQKCLGWKPLSVVQETYKNTTQYATNYVCLPMREHFKSHFPALNARRIHEVVATDTFFAAERALGGEKCAQLYVGKESIYTRIYGMKTESQMPNTLGDYICEVGAPYALLSDNARSETSEAVKDYLRKYRIKDMQTEPMHPNQNPAERRIQEVKKFTLQMMDRIKCLSNLWMLCMLHAADILNHLAHVNLKNRTPTEVMFGVTPDISSLIQFHWYQPVFYYDRNASYPDSKEKYGHFVGVAHNVGDALTYKVLTDHDQVIMRSVLRPADDLKNPNKRVRFVDEVEANHEHSTDKGIKEFDTICDTIPEQQLKMPYVDPKNLIGFKFISSIDGNPFFTQVKEQLEDNKYLVSLGDGEREDIMTYNQIMDMINDKLIDPEAGIWAFDDILDHRIRRDKKYEVLVKWSTGEETWEPLSIIAKTDPVTCGRYAKDQDLLNTPQWKRFRHYAKDAKHIMRLRKNIQAYNSK